MTEETKSETPKVTVVDNTALAVIERAQIDMQITTARQYPRTLSKVKEDMMEFATLDEETASACFYTLPRSNKIIQGPSIRMAEIAVASYGNLRAGVRCIETVLTGNAPHAVLQAVAHDLEKNVAITIEKRRRIIGKKSKGSAIDEDDINLAVNAGAAVAFRDVVFKIVPQALIKPVWQAAKKVAVGDVKSLAVKRGQVIERLKQMGAREDRILTVVRARKVDDVGMDELEVLIGLGTAIKDGEITLEEAFPALQEEQPKGAAGLAAKLKDEAKAPEPAPETTVSDPTPAADSPNLEKERLGAIKALKEIKKQRAQTFEKALVELKQPATLNLDTLSLDMANELLEKVRF